MGDRSGIEWTDATWNPVRGCSIVSKGCEHCYAMRQAHRMDHPGGAYEGLTRSTPSGPKWTGQVKLVAELLDQPLRWRKPRRIFVNSMSDLFHEDVPDEFIDEVFAIKQWGEWAVEGQTVPLRGGGVFEVEAGTYDTIWPDGTRGAGAAHERGGLGACVWRVGKHAAGRELDGRTWDEYPA